MKKWSIYIVSALIILFVISRFFPIGSSVIFTNSENSKRKIDVIIADSQAERTQGLSGVEKLENNSGMLFIFPEDSDSAFWMKDMKIPLDMIFVDSEQKIVDIKENQLPCEDVDHCELIYPSKKYIYVVELNSGFTKENEVKVGDRIKIFR